MYASHLKYLRGLGVLYEGGDWQFCWSARSVEAVEVNGYEIKPGAYLKGAIANEDTIWPEGFDPEAAGVIFD